MCQLSLEAENLGNVIPIKIHCQSNKHFLVCFDNCHLHLSWGCFFFHIDQPTHTKRPNEERKKTEHCYFGTGFKCQSTFTERWTKLVLTWHKLNLAAWLWANSLGWLARAQNWWYGMAYDSWEWYLVRWNSVCRLSVSLYLAILNHSKCDICEL